MPYVDMLSPPLTTIRIAQREMGDKAARLLLAKISDPEARHDHIVLAPELIARGSTASPRR
jgi:LacI family transcriptional regulator